MSGLSQWDAQAGSIADGDLVGTTDIDDSTQSANGTSKKVTFTQIVTYLAGKLGLTNLSDVGSTTPTQTVTPGSLERWSRLTYLILATPMPLQSTTT